MKFLNPPVVEVVIGAQFKDSVFNNKAIFDYYSQIKDTYPNIQENQILPAIVEKNNAPNIQRLIAGFNSRKLFINNNDSRLIQIQANKLLFNWRKTQDEDYPHFNSVIKEFRGIYNNLNRLHNIENKLDQLEITYVDHFLLEEFQKEDYNPSSILNILNIEDPMKNIECSITFPIKELSSNLNFTLRSATRNIDNKKLIVMETTCRGFNSNISIFSWYDQAHKEVANLFLKFTTNSAKKKWEII